MRMTAPPPRRSSRRALRVRPYPRHHEKRYRRKDGGVIWVDGSAFVAPVVAGAPLFATVVVDITDRKRAEEDLRRSEASLAQAQHISRTGSWRWNVGTGAISSSAELLHIWGFDAMATQPSYTTFMARVHPEDRPCVRAGSHQRRAREERIPMGVSDHPAAWRGQVPAKRWPARQH